MDGGALGAALIILVSFGGLAGTIAAAGWAKGERLRAGERAKGQPASAATQDAVLTELRVMKQQIAEMQSTSHQFDISFDAALNRLESRVDRLETKSATAVTPARTDTPQSLHNGATP